MAGDHPDVGSLWAASRAVKSGLELVHAQEGEVQVHWRVSPADWHFLRRCTAWPFGPIARISLPDEDGDGRLFGDTVRIVRPPAEQAFPELVVRSTRRVGWPR